MPQKPVDQRHPLAGNDAVWAAMLELTDAGRDITVTAIHGKALLGTERGKGEIREYLRRLCLAGVCTVQAGAGQFAAARYTLVQRPAQAPQLDKDGRPAPETAQQRLWRAIRMARVFTVADLTATVEAKASAVESYLKHLVYAGYLTRTGDQYRLVRQHGPLAPMIQRVKQVYDPNLKAVVWPKELGA